jgi:anti-sigma regulatory factor (Ser/Thr protein kinase)
MAGPSTRYDDALIETTLLDLVSDHPTDLVRVVAERVGTTRPTVLLRVRNLIAGGYLSSSGGKRPTYRIGKSVRRSFRYGTDGLEEDEVWRRDVRPLLDGVAKNVLALCQHGLTEMVNNAIDHSDADAVTVFVDRNPERIAMVVDDDGVGIFRKIAAHLELPDERLALLELAKGKFTTDPDNHTGEGVFFSSRMFDSFQIVSGSLTFDHDDREPDNVLVEAEVDRKGTSVVMVVSPTATRTIKAVFDEFSSGPDDYAFAKTVVPVRMAVLGEENLLSRSQARRLLQRVDRFRTVVLDFAGVDTIGQAFADEIFRVFAAAHPEIELIPTHAAAGVKQMVRRARGGQAPLLE